MIVFGATASRCFPTRLETSPTGSSSGVPSARRRGCRVEERAARPQPERLLAARLARRNVAWSPDGRGRRAAAALHLAPIGEDIGRNAGHVAETDHLAGGDRVGERDAVGKADGQCVKREAAGGAQLRQRACSWLWCSGTYARGSITITGQSSAGHRFGGSSIWAHRATGSNTVE